MQWPLVGRDRDLAEGSEAIGSTPGLLIVGGAGVGKSRLAAELAARTRGSAVRWIAATEATRSVPFGAFASLLPNEMPTDRMQLLQSLRARIRAIGDDVMLVIDDAHLLDEASLALVWVLATEGAATILGTVRSGDPVPTTITDLWKDQHLARLALEPLSRDDTETLLSAVLGTVEDHLLEELWALTRGVPLHLREVVESAAQRGTITRRDGRWGRVGPLTHGSGRLVDLVQARLEGLSGPERDAYDLVALAAPVPRAVVIEAIDVDAVAAVEAAQRVSEVEGVDGVLRPAHPLHAEVTVSALSHARRRALLGRLARAAAELGFPPPADRLRAALWQLEAGAVEDASLALAGADTALDRNDGATAERLVRPVVEASGSPAAAARLCRSLNQQSRYDEAEAVCQAVEGAHGATAMELALARARNLALGLHRPRHASKVLAEVSAALEADDQRAVLDAERSLMAAFAGDFDATLEACHDVLRNRSAPPRARATVQVHRALAWAMTGDVAAVLRRHEEAVAEIEATGAEVPLALDQYLISRVDALLAAGRIHDARDLISERSRADDGTTPVPAWMSHDARTAALTGDLVAAARAMRRSIAAHERADPFGLLPQARGVAAMIAGQRGDAEQAEQHLEAIDDSVPEEPRIGVWIARGRLWALAARGSLEEAAALAADRGAWVARAGHVTWAIWLLHDAVRIGHAEPVRELLREAVGRTRGAELQERLADHARLLASEDAHELLTCARGLADTGALLFGAEAAAQASGLLAEHGDEVGAARAAARSAAWRRHCTDANTPALQLPQHGPTPRELDVAVLAAEGRTSPQIAERLFVSVRTVDNHLHSLYRKLGINARRDLATFLSPLPPEGVRAG